MIVWGWAAVARAACTAVVGTTAHLPDGPAADVTVVWVDDRIAAVGRSLPELAGTGAATTWRGAPCTRIDGAGTELTAGLVAAPTGLGLVEVDLESATHEEDPHTDDPVLAAVVVVDGYDPLSTPIAVQRLQGITSAVPVPAGGTVSGIGGFVRLTGATQAAAVVDREVVMVATVPTQSWGDGLRILSDLLADARTHARSPQLYDAGRPYATGASRADLEALDKVVRRELPLLIGAQASWQVEALLRWKAKEQVDLVIGGAAEGWQVASALAEAKVPVLVDPLVYGPGGFDQMAARPDNAKLLDAAGVEVLLTTNATHNARTLRQIAGNAVRGGMDHESALRAITERPARVFGQPDRGVIRAGAVADVVLWSGDPLELATRVLHEWIGGAEVTLRSRQTELFEKYRRLPGTPGPVPPLPGR